MQSAGGARRAQCINNLKQIGLAIANYESALGCIVPGYISWRRATARSIPCLGARCRDTTRTLSAGQRAGLGVAGLVLALCGADAALQRIQLQPADLGRGERHGGHDADQCLPLPVGQQPDPDLPDGRRQSEPAAGGEPVLRPGQLPVQHGLERHEHPAAEHSYDDPVRGCNGPIYRNSRVLAGVTDGLSNTVFASEKTPYLADAWWVGIIPGYRHFAYNAFASLARADRINYDYPGALLASHSGPSLYEVPEVIHPPNSPLGHTDEFYSLHPGGANVLMGDGSVRFVKESINLLTWQALSSRRRGGDQCRRLLTRSSCANGRQARGVGSRATLLVSLVLLLTGCGEPSVRELKNRRELEALLTAISLRNTKELDKDIQRIEDRHNSGELERRKLQGPAGDRQKGTGRELG